MFIAATLRMLKSKFLLFFFREIPTILEYISYMFSFQTVLTGPLCFYTDYQRFISGENLNVKNQTVIFLNIIKINNIL